MNDINADFYLLNLTNGKSWNKEYAPIPDNHYFLPKDIVPEYMTFDFILSQSRYSHYEVAVKIAKTQNLKLVTLEHTIPTSNFNIKELKQLKRMLGDYNIYISDFNKAAWEDTNGAVVNHCVDSDLFISGSHENNVILTVQNQYIARNYCLNYTLYKYATSGLPVLPVGDTPGLSKPAKDIDELIKYYQSSRIFLNTAHESPIPTSLLEAMSCGCACVSIKSCAIPEYITHGHDGLLCSSLEEMQAYLNELLYNKDLADFLGNNARETIKAKCSKELFTNNWNKVIGQIA